MVTRSDVSDVKHSSSCSYDHCCRLLVLLPPGEDQITVCLDLQDRFATLVGDRLLKPCEFVVLLISYTPQHRLKISAYPGKDRCNAVDG